MKNHSDELIFHSQGLRRSAANLVRSHRRIRLREILLACLSAKRFDMEERMKKMLAQRGSHFWKPRKARLLHALACARCAGMEARVKKGTPGKVWIAGAGSEEGLITVRALRAVREADAIVYDELMDHRVLSEAKDGCELIAAGKRKNDHTLEQREIEKLLVDLSRSGKRVVRLKGGDPTVFGRGAEEALRLEAEGIPYELIPGVSSCIAGPERMGIPVTHRGTASSFCVVTGHGDPKTAEAFDTLARFKGTILYMMGLSRADAIAEGLLGAGKDPETPVSILSCVYTNKERRIDGRLCELGALAGRAKAPAILVIGKAAGMDLRGGRGEERRPGQAEDAPLKDGKAVAGTKRPGSPGTVLVVGTRSFTERMAGALEEKGFSAVSFPCIGITPSGERIPESFRDYDWLVFTSANGVRVFLEEMDRRGMDLRSLSGLRIACIGRGTAGELQRAHLYADLIPDAFTSEALAGALAGAVRPGEKVLILRAEEANPVLTNRLKNEKILYDDCRIYSARYEEPEEAAGGRSFDPKEADYVVFASAGGVRAFLRENPYPGDAAPVCIGELTARELKKRTSRKALIAPECSVKGIVSALCEDSGVGIRESGSLS